MIVLNGSRFDFSGPLTIATVSEWLRESEALFADDGVWELNLAGVEDVDSAAVSLLLEWARQAAQRGRQLQLRNLPENLQCLLKVYDVQELLPAA
ncbi:MAG: STAS domain-containing protein [Sulfurimicrobium sp.]|nr:STAS domain-containing protein [Sulfurimicrobium sp.]MDO9190648.1 STAS domain-containing protein [Sulfurimicrobium sp.]MDP1705371.1 STAS domain-containing protein [Sulfurimicrobium sp.]MDP1898381.1 STAS domain-containing protein [Sulfurimicrobium sp.]MDP2199600.1 STAS domain-containing protein [Sulfurimicrobium sp.]